MIDGMVTFQVLTGDAITESFTGSQSDDDEGDDVNESQLPPIFRALYMRHYMISSHPEPTHIKKYPVRHTSHLASVRIYRFLLGPDNGGASGPCTKKGRFLLCQVCWYKASGPILVSGSQPLYGNLYVIGLNRKIK